MTRHDEGPTDAYGLIMRVSIPNQPGMLAQVATAIGAEGGNIGAIDTPQISHDRVVRDITVAVENSRHGHRIVEAVKAIHGVRVVNVSDPIMLAHLGGKIEIALKKPLRTRADLSTFYTPGVAGVSMAIHDHPQKVYSLTMKGNTIAIVTDGTAVLGLGDIGPAAALPVMEGKAMLFKEFGGVDAVPVCLATKDPCQIVDTVKYLSPGFGGVNLEDISAPRCFEIEDRLRAELDIPVFHDDQHGTAVVVLAALINALQIVGKQLCDVKIVINGMGAAGVSTARLLLVAGVHNIVGCDRAGILHRRRHENMNAVKEQLAECTNPDGQTGTLVDAIVGADVFIGVSGPDLLPAEAIGKMAHEPIVFALANPVPEVKPLEAAPYARVIATGRSDYPNQINNVLCFPGLFRGVLDSRAREINDEMKLDAAHAIAEVVGKRELHDDYIIPSVFDKRVARNVARAVVKAAQRTGVAQRHREVHYGT